MLIEIKYSNRSKKILDRAACFTTQIQISSGHLLLIKCSGEDMEVGIPS